MDEVGQQRGVDRMRVLSWGAAGGEGRGENTAGEARDAVRRCVREGKAAGRKRRGAAGMEEE